MYMLTRSAGVRAALCAAIAIAVPSLLSAQNTTESIACGSSAGVQLDCKTNGIPNRVEVARDLSGGRCRRGRTWGFNDSLIWTNGGCRADFSLFYRVGDVDPNPLTEVITCGRRDGTQMECPTDGSATAVRLVRNLGTASCTQGQSWGHTGSHIWTNRGCRAEFEVSYAAAGGGPKPARVVTCGASAGRVSCNTFGTVSNVRLVRELSYQRCRQGSTWGFSANDLWTTSGCRGEFELSYEGVVQPR